MRGRHSRILIVDDEPANLALLDDVLRTRYLIQAANSGARALRAARKTPPPDLILLDIMMPGMDGFEVLGELRADPRTAGIPVVFVTARSDSESEESGLRAGAVDYINKPISPAVVRARVNVHLQLKQARDALKHRNASLEVEIGRRMAENQAIQDASIHALGYLAETRDNDTGNHIRRTSAYVRLLAGALAKRPQYAGQLTEHRIELLAKSAPLHDIGKVGVPDRVLLKPGKLTAEEWAVMQTHAALGADALDRARGTSEQHVEFLDVAYEITRWHHEKWDGSGYPDGLAGEAIPLPARLMALADVFDALISKRVYKSAMSLDQARTIILEGAGAHFDPQVVEAFIEVWDDFIDVALRYGDHEPSAAGREDP
jgi:putative two-component system response regulator